MFSVSLEHFLFLGAILFTIGILGIFLNKKNVIIILMSIELRASTLIWSEIFCFFTPLRSLKVRTIDPIIATNKIKPDNWKR